MMFRRKRIALSLVTLGLVATVLSGPVSAQESTPTAPMMQPGSTIEVTGIGSVKVLADSAILQLVMYSNGFSGAYFEESVAIEEGSATPAAFSEFSPVMEVAVTEEQLAAVASALEANGIAPDQYEMQTAESLISGFFGPGSAIIGIQLSSDQIVDVNDILVAARQAANDVGATIDQFNIAYQIADCTAVTRSAAAAALADGQTRAQELADLLGVQLGNLISVSRQSVYDSIYLSLLGAASPCETELTLEDAFTTYFSGAGSSTDGMVEIFAGIALTYETA